MTFRLIRIKFKKEKKTIFQKEKVKKKKKHLLTQFVFVIEGMNQLIN
jgi:hypothetical protein